MKNTLLGLITALAMTSTGHAVEPLNSTASAGLYEVTITNITKGQTFTPIIAATHRPGTRFFTLGQEASPELAELAEGGATGPLADLLAQSELVGNISTTDGLLGPGESVMLEIEGDYIFSRLSVAAMLIPTNDTFFALDRVRLPQLNLKTTALAYDSGSELNDELCISIPGPTCGGEGGSVDDGEGFVHVANGIVGDADLGAGVYDWRGPVARIVIKRVH